MSEWSSRNWHDSEANPDRVKVIFGLHSLLVYVVATVFIFLASPILNPVANDTVVIVALLIETDINIKLWHVRVNTWV